MFAAVSNNISHGNLPYFWWATSNPFTSPGTEMLLPPRSKSNGIPILKTPDVLKPHVDVYLKNNKSL